MIFALSTDDRTLHVFATEAEAISYCESVDVEDGGWRFFDRNGEALEAVFIKPNKRESFWVTSGIYTLRHSAAPQKHLFEEIEGVAVVEGPSPFNTVAEIKKLLVRR